MATVSRSTYLCFSTLINQFESIMQKLTYQNFAYDVLLKKIDHLIEESSLQGQSFSEFKNHMANYKSILDAMREANQYDINDCTSAINCLKNRKETFENVLDGDYLFSKKEEAEADCSNYRIQAGSAYYEYLYGNPDNAELNYNRYQYLSGMAEYSNQQAKIYEEKINRLQLIEDETCLLFQKGDEMRQYISNGLDLLKLDYKYVNGYVVYQGTANSSWLDMYLEVKKKNNQEIINEFYEGLPETLKSYVSPENFECTDDGLVVCKKSFADIFMEAGIEDTTLLEKNDSDVENYYDDQYLFGVKDEDGKYTYGVMCMREYEDDATSGAADSDYSGVAISFVELDIDKFDAALAAGPDWNSTEEGKQAMKEFTDNFGDVTSPNHDSRHSEILQKYFSRLESKGSYLVADIFIDKIAHTADENREIKLPRNFSTTDTRVINRLKLINEESGCTIYDEKEGCLVISDPDNLTEYEKLAILTAYTGDENRNMFSAEVKYHADEVAKWYAKILYINIDFLGKDIYEFDYYNKAIKADMQVGTGREYDVFYDSDDKTNTDQEIVHGEK